MRSSWTPNVSGGHVQNLSSLSVHGILRWPRAVHAACSAPPTCEGPPLVVAASHLPATSSAVRLGRQCSPEVVSGGAAMLPHGDHSPAESAPLPGKAMKGHREDMEGHGKPRDVIGSLACRVNAFAAEDTDGTWAQNDARPAGVVERELERLARPTLPKHTPRVSDAQLIVMAIAIDGDQRACQSMAQAFDVDSNCADRWQSMASAPAR